MKREANTRTWIRKLQHQVAEGIAGYKYLLLAFSGGLDSTVLLDILTLLRDREEKNPISIRAIHVNHGMSEKANYWDEHCSQQCWIRNVPCSIIRISVDHSPDGIEASARCMRYKGLYNHLLPHEVLLTAHHLDDQVETFFLALKRGSGPSGLSAMAKDTFHYGSHLLRPLLSCSREWMEAYARERKLKWIEDDSNTDLRFDRNFLRLYIFPRLRQRWPYFSKVVARSACLCAEQEKLIDELLSENLEKLMRPDGSILIPALVSMSPFRRRALLRRWLASCRVRMPSQEKLDRIWDEVALSRRDAIPKIPLDNCILRRFRDRLYLLPIFMTYPMDEVEELSWPSDKTTLFLPKGLGVLTRYLVATTSSGGIVSVKHESISSSLVGIFASVTNINNPSCKIVATKCIVRAPHPHERVSVRFGKVSGLLHIVGRHRGRTIKKLWQELQIPPWLRKRIPLLFYNQKLIAALGAFVTRENEIWHEEETEKKREDIRVTNTPSFFSPSGEK